MIAYLFYNFVIRGNIAYVIIYWMKKFVSPFVLYSLLNIIYLLIYIYQQMCQYWN